MVITLMLDGVIKVSSPRGSLGVDAETAAFASQLAAPGFEITSSTPAAFIAG